MTKYNVRGGLLTGIVDGDQRGFTVCGYVGRVLQRGFVMRHKYFPSIDKNIQIYEGVEIERVATGVDKWLIEWWAVLVVKRCAINNFKLLDRNMQIYDLVDCKMVTGRLDCCLIAVAISAGSQGQLYGA